MGKVKYLKEVREFFKKTPVVSINDVKLLVKNSNYAHILLNYLLKRGEIKRIEKGFYTIHEDPTYMVFAIRPCYIGLQSALSIHNLWEQETNTILITPRKLRVGIRDVFGSNVIIKRIDKKYFFGYELVRYDDYYIPVSDIEKTLIDLIYFNVKIDKKIFYKVKLDEEKIREYLKKYPKNKVKKILKFRLCRNPIEK